MNSGTPDSGRLNPILTPEDMDELAKNRAGEHNQFLPDSSGESEFTGNSDEEQANNQIESETKDGTDNEAEGTSGATEGSGSTEGSPWKK